MTIRKFALIMGVALVVAGCAVTQEEELMCEPGLEDLSHVATTVTAPGC